MEKLGGSHNKIYIYEISSQYPPGIFFFIKKKVYKTNREFTLHSSPEVVIWPSRYLQPTNEPWTYKFHFGDLPCSACSFPTFPR